MTGIMTDVDASGDFGTVSPPDPRTSSVIQDVQTGVIPRAKQAFSRASSGVESFVENNPELSKWGSIGIALIAAPSLFRTMMNAVQNPAGFAKDAVMLGGKIAAGLALANFVGAFVSNGDFSWDGAKNALSQTVDDVGNLIGMNGDAEGQNDPPEISEDGTGPASVTGGSGQDGPAADGTAGTETGGAGETPPEQEGDADVGGTDPATTQPVGSPYKRPPGIGL